MLAVIQQKRKSGSMVDNRNPLLFTGAGTKLLLNERDSDVAIVVEFGGTLWRYPAHKLVLGTMSDVFRGMFRSGMKENEDQEVRVQDANPLAMKQFLRFLYLGTTDFVDWREILELMTVAHKYRVHELIQLCEKQLMMSLNLSNTCLLYEVANLYGLDLLKLAAQDVILDSSFVVCFTEGFVSLGRNSVESILSHRRMNSENEGSVLTCVREWATAECSRKCEPLSRDNILNHMEPLLKYIDFKLIPESERTFIPRKMIDKHKGTQAVRRVGFNVSPSLYKHFSLLKFVVELGAYGPKHSYGEPLQCLKFCVDSYIYIAGFRLVALFKSNFQFGSGNPILVLSREGSSQDIQFNMNPLLWKNGCPSGEYIWKEMVAYLPHPARVDPFTTYHLHIKYGNIVHMKWPKTRLENNLVNTEWFPINFYSYGACTGITELFLLPASSYKHVCNKSPK